MIRYTVKKSYAIETYETGHNDMKHLRFIQEFETRCNIYIFLNSWYFNNSGCDEERD